MMPERIDAAPSSVMQAVNLSVMTATAVETTHIPLDADMIAPCLCAE
jgi:hypothetical protein